MIVIMKWDLTPILGAFQMTAEVIWPARAPKFLKSFKKGIDNPKEKCYIVIVKGRKKTTSLGRITRCK